MSLCKGDDAGGQEAEGRVAGWGTGAAGSLHPSRRPAAILGAGQDSTESAHPRKAPRPPNFFSQAGGRRGFCMALERPFTRFRHPLGGQVPGTQAIRAGEGFPFCQQRAVAVPSDLRPNTVIVSGLIPGPKR